MSLVHNSLSDALEWVENQNFKGYDPYDGPNSQVLNNLISKGGRSRFYIQQLFKRLPINLRSQFQIKKGYNPKALGLLLSVYSKMYKLDPKEKYIDLCERIIKILIRTKSNFSNLSWGYNFDWIGKEFFLKKYNPSIVVTSTVIRGLFDFYHISNNEQIIKMIASSSKFIMEDLPRFETSKEICFSYTPFFENKVHNANLLGAESLVRHYSLSGCSKSKEFASKAFDYTIKRQLPDGSWTYSDTLHQSRIQTDWHQGFIIDSIYEYLKLVDNKKEYLDALMKGSDYYQTVQFKKDGTCYWRYPKYWPIDIHNQSQGIITFAKISEFNKRFYDFSNIIAIWTIKNMQSKAGFFYHQKWPKLINKIPYIRWSQSWMLYALVTLSEKQKNEAINQE